MSESIDFLYSSPDALPSDKVLCEWVKGQQIAENIGMQFSMDDPFATVQSKLLRIFQPTDPCLGYDCWCLYLSIL